MRATRNRQRGAIVIAMVVVIAILATLTPASAAQATIVAGPGNTFAPFYTPLVVIQKGKTVNFLNLDTQMHNVYSAKAPVGSLFKSATITFFKQTPVVGVKNLPKGSYKFVCTLHSLMTGTLRVI